MAQGFTKGHQLSGKNISMLFILVVTFFAFATLSYCAVLFLVDNVQTTHFVKQLTESIRLQLKKTCKTVRIDKQIHRGISTRERLGMYMLLMTIGVFKAIILSTM